jgi:hypothetical protein
MAGYSFLQSLLVTGAFFLAPRKLILPAKKTIFMRKKSAPKRGEAHLQGNPALPKPACPARIHISTIIPFLI